MKFIYILDLIGTFTFALSGALSAMTKKLDLLGIFVIGVITAVGGGTLRDLMLGRTPVFWIDHIEYLAVVVFAVAAAYAFTERFLQWKRTFFLFDTIGLGVFTVIGLNIASDLNIHMIPGILLGMTTAVVGGVLRDILCNDIPLILRKEIYATACLAGGGVYYLMGYFNGGKIVTVCCTMAVIIGVRLVAVKYSLALPRPVLKAEPR